MMQKIVPHLWFAAHAREAVEFYKSVFDGVKIISVSHYTEAGKDIHGMDPGTELGIEFDLEGFRFMAINGGSMFTPNPAISFFVHLPTKEAVTEAWEKLLVGGKALMPLDTYDFNEHYGWVEDQFGVSWQLSLTSPLPKQRIVPSLLFTQEHAGKAGEAIAFYTSVFKNSKIGMKAPYPAGMEHEKEGSLMYADFILEGQTFVAMDSGNPGHEFEFNEGISLVVRCETQAEVDYYWERLTADPKSEQCGWLKDKFGVSWQVTPTIIETMLTDPDKRKVNRVMEALFPMKKLDIATLEKAYSG